MFTQLKLLASILNFFLFKLCLNVWRRTVSFITGNNIHSLEAPSDSQCEVFAVYSKFPAESMLVDNEFLYNCVHEKFVDLNYLLKPNITMFYSTATHIILAETDPDADIYNTRKYPFFFLAQAKFVNKLIAAPIEQFMKLSERVGLPKCTTSWMFHTTRCGSTALAQALHTLPNFTVISENQFICRHLTEVALSGRNADDYISSPEFTQLLSICINFMFKDFGENDQVCFKTPGSWAYQPLLPLLASRYPQHHIIAIHRDGKGTVESFWNGLTNRGRQLFNGFIKLSYLTGILKSMNSRLICLISSGAVRDLSRFDMLFTVYMMWTTNLRYFVKYGKEVKKLLPLVYDDLQRDRPAVISQMLKFLDIPADSLDICLSALNEDSQKGTPIGRDTKSKPTPLTWSKQTIERCNQALAECSLPLFGDKFRFSRGLEIVPL